MRMYDSTNVDAIPAEATEVLAYTDGRYANVDTLRQRFPNARLHTISAVGQAPGEFIDVEPGCVWPPNQAVDLYHSWQKAGCKGFYCSVSTTPTIRQLLTPGDNPEWFEADPTGIAHIRPGDVATQYEWAPGYDTSDTSPALDPINPPAPAPQPPYNIGEEVPNPSGKLNAPITCAYERPNHPGQGWRFGSDGGVFPYGGAPMFGNPSSVHLAAPIVAAAVAENGYTMIGSDGGSFPYGPEAPKIDSLA